MKKIITTVLFTLVGILGLQTFYVKTTSSKDLIKTIRKIRGNDSSKKTTSKNVTQATFDITNISTGYKGFQPAVKITVKNNSGNDITEFNKFKAVFLLNNKIYGDDSEYITSSSDFLPKGATKTIVLNPYKKGLYEQLRKRKPNVTVSLYLNDTKMKELSIEYVNIKDGSSLKSIYQRDASTLPSKYDGLGVEINNK